MMVLLTSIALSSLVFTAHPTAQVDVASLKVSVRELLNLIYGLRALMRRSEKQNLIILPSLLRYNAKAKRYPFKQEEIGFVKFNITAGERPASIVTTTACSRLCFHFDRLRKLRAPLDSQLPRPMLYLPYL